MLNSEEEEMQGTSKKIAMQNVNKPRHIAKLLERAQ
jgi:hypothetical protein